MKPTGLYSWSRGDGGRLSKLGRELWQWGPKSCYYMLHKSHELLLHKHLLLMKELLLPLELILTSLELCKVGSSLMCLSCLILLHPLKNGNQCGVRLRCQWS